MAIITWQGPVTGSATWNTAANWNGGIPSAGDIVTMTPNLTGSLTVTVATTAIPAIDSLTIGDSVPSHAITIAGTTAWNFGAGVVELNVPSTTSAFASTIVVWQTPLSGTGKIRKTGLGTIYWNSATSMAGWTGGMDVYAGFVGIDTASTKLGTGTITLAADPLVSADTGLFIASNTSYTIANKIIVANSYNVYLNNAAATTSATMTLSGIFEITPGVTPTLTIGNGTATTGSVTISGALTGTAGFTKAGTGLLSLTNAAGTNTITGPISVTGAAGFAGALTLGSGTGFLVPTSVIPGSAGAYPSINVSAASDVLRIYATGANVTFNNLFSGSGVVNVISNATAPTGPNFAAGTLTGLTGTGGFTGSAGTIAQTSGLVLQPTAGSAPAQNVISSSPDLPVTLGYLTSANLATVTGTFKYTGSLVAPQLQKILLACYAGTTNLAASSYSLEANQPNLADAPLDISTGIQRGNDLGGNMVFTLAGTHAGNNTVSGAITSASSGTLGITKAQAGRWILSGANTYTGATSTVASGGTLVAKSGGATTGALGGTTGAVTIVSGTTLEIDGSAASIALTKSSATLTIGGTGDSTKGAIYSYGDGLVDSSNSYTSSSTVLSTATTIQVGTKNTLTMTGAIGSGVNVYGITQIGAGKLVLPSSGYLGVTTINGGTIETATLANGSAASGVGQSSNAAANLLIGTTANAGTLRYTGAAVSTDRNWTAGTAGATIDASGSGVLTMTSTTVPSFSASNTATTITVQGDAGNGTATFNTYSQPVSNNGTGAVGFTKAGTGAWKLTNATIDATGALTVSGGFLDLNNTARGLSANIVASGGTLQNGSATVTPASSVALSGGKITANLAGASKTLTVTGASLATVSELAPEATNNAGLTGGAASINSGTLRLTAETNTIGSGGGKVLGTMAATVAGGAAIRTTTGGNQRGQARYQDLTFSSGSSLYIGG